MAEKTSLIFFGTEAWGIPSLERLIDDGQHIAAVVTKPDAPSGRGRKLVASPIKEAAKRHNLPVLEPAKLGDATAELANLKPTAAVVIAYGKLLPQAILNLFPRGVVNFHPSALPQFRGPSPIESAILAGEPVAYSIMMLSAGMDDGDVLLTKPFHDRASATMTAPELYEAVGRVGAADLASCVTAVLNGTAESTPQDHAAATVCPLITKADGAIDWVKPATQLEREVRAYAGWPGSYGQLGGRDVTITAAHVGDTVPMVGTSSTGAKPGTLLKTGTGELAVITGHGELIIDRLKPAGKREMTGREFLAGLRL